VVEYIVLIADTKLLGDWKAGGASARNAVPFR
jgi:hypothetical protein